MTADRRKPSARETLARLGGTMPTEEQQQVNLDANLADLGAAPVAGSASFSALVDALQQRIIGADGTCLECGNGYPHKPDCPSQVARARVEDSYREAVLEGEKRIDVVERERVAAQLGERMAKASARAMEIERDEARAERDRAYEEHRQMQDRVRRLVEGTTEARERADRLAAALRLAFRVAESWIHDQLDGTGMLDGALAELDPARAALRALVPETQAATDPEVKT